MDRHAILRWLPVPVLDMGVPDIKEMREIMEALERVQHLYATHMPKVSRHPESPQTHAQKNFIRCWNIAP